MRPTAIIVICLAMATLTGNAVADGNQKTEPSSDTGHPPQVLIDSGEKLPFRHEITDEWKSLGAAEAKKFKEHKLDPDNRTVQYVAAGNYLNYGNTMSFRETDRLKFDDDGLPTTFNGGKFNYNSVTLENFALAAWGRYLDGKAEAQEVFLKSANKLAQMQSPDGSIPNDFPYRHYTSTQQYAPGWTDGMGPGIALSVYARAYKLTGDAKWRHLADDCVKFLQVPAPYGPFEKLTDIDPSLSDYFFFSEYPTQPHVYTLNGNMFTLLGLYDWWIIGESEDAGRLWKGGIKSLEKLLPYFDIGTFSAYDLSYITYSKLPYLKPREPHLNASYHNVHIYQLRALYSITGDKILKDWADKWYGYVK